ncbi:Heat shock protein [Hirschfeldia incana]|nr:Heat shock protein [Hirschfeldia incana]
MVLIPSNRSIISFFLFLTLIHPLLTEKPKAMRVHPILNNNNNTLIHHHLHNPTRGPGKNLRRLPHIFNRVLELPLRSEADVSVEERHDCFRFVAETEGLCGGGGEMRAYVVDIHPGITKIVVRTNGLSLGLSLDELELDVWRFRLPETTRAELVTVVCVDGVLIVTVPKMVSEEDDDGDGGGFGQGIRSGRLVLVQ